LSVAALVIGLIPPDAAAQDKECAVVVMHGKWGNPQYIGFFGRRLDPVCVPKMIEMPWSKRRNYDEPYPFALAEIAAQVKAFRDQGYQRVLLAGHSFGANAALAYMAEIGDVDGVIALAPGHVPAKMYERGIGKDVVDKARELVAAGKGDETLSMDDLNQGQRQGIRMSATVLLSYFDPQGLGHMPATTARFKKPVPLLWVVGTKDPLYPAGSAFAFDLAPPHPASKYLVVEADHANTPEAAVGEVLVWIKGLP
jgi:pimeloyl-ACP methyl ester carboxylesterase